MPSPEDRVPPSPLILTTDYSKAAARGLAQINAANYAKPLSGRSNAHNQASSRGPHHPGK
jgi:hypothetical protein